MYTEIIKTLKEANVIVQNGTINSKYKVILNKHPLVLNDLFTLTDAVVIKNASIRERLYVVINNIQSPVLCKHCKTNRVVFIENGKKRNTYHTYCSLKCSNGSLAVKEAKKSSYRIKFGVDNPSQSEIIKDKKVKTSLLRYGSKFPWQHDKRIDLLENKQWLYNKHKKEQLSLTEIASITGVDVSVVSNYMKKHKLLILNHKRSVGEKEIVSFLESKGISCITNDRSLINPQEIDILLPEHNIAIEYCGLYWHSEQAGKDHRYHQQKMLLCKKAGVQLLTIFEDEWKFRTEQVKRKLLHLLNKSEEKLIYARKCDVRIVNSTDKRLFFQKNHIQGNGPSSINIGLYHNNELVSVMSFIEQKQVYYLNRYATSCRVVGGFGKLMNYFVNNLYNRDKEIISFADLRWSTGKLYQVSGWNRECEIPPDYYYSLDAKRRFHKFNFRRKNLPKLLKNFNKTLSERVNCDLNNVLRIWDCGKIKFTFNT